MEFPPCPCGARCYGDVEEQEMRLLTAGLRRYQRRILQAIELSTTPKARVEALTEVMTHCQWVLRKVAEARHRFNPHQAELVHRIAGQLGNALSRAAERVFSDALRF